MKLEYQSSVLFCDDLEKQKAFYTDFLGQPIEMDLGSCVILKNHLTLWQLKKSYPISRELGFTYEPIGNRNLELCFETDNFADAVEKVLMSDLRMLHNVEEEEWGQYTIRFYDPEGNLVEIGETMVCLVSRMKDSGMEVQQIVEKSGLDRAFVESLLKKNNKI